MKFEKTYCYLSVLLLFLGSCTGKRYYTAEKIVTPLFNDKYQFYVDVSGNIPRGVNLDCGFSFTNNFALMISSGFVKENQSSFFGNTNYHSSYNNSLSYGLGYFNNKRSNPAFNFETFFSYTKGKYDVYNQFTNMNTQKQSSTTFLGKYDKYSLQFNIGRRQDKSPIKWSYFFKIGNIKYNHPEMYFDGAPIYDFPINWKKPYYTFEQGLAFKFGENDVKIQLQLQLNHGLYVNKESDAIKQFEPFAYLGLVFMPSSQKNWIVVK
jgi:hypothetical protein